MKQGRKQLKNALFRMHENFKKWNVLCEVNLNKGRNDLKNDLFRMHENFKNQMFYARLQKFKQGKQQFKINFGWLR